MGLSEAHITRLNIGAIVFYGVVTAALGVYGLVYAGVVTTEYLSYAVQSRIDMWSDVDTFRAASLGVAGISLLALAHIWKRRSSVRYMDTN